MSEQKNNKKVCVIKDMNKKQYCSFCRTFVYRDNLQAHIGTKGHCQREAEVWSDYMGMPDFGVCLGVNTAKQYKEKYEDEKKYEEERKKKYDDEEKKIKENEKKKNAENRKKKIAEKKNRKNNEKKSRNKKKKKEKESICVLLDLLGNNGVIKV